MQREEGGERGDGMRQLKLLYVQHQRIFALLSGDLTRSRMTSFMTLRGRRSAASRWSTSTVKSDSRACPF